MSNQLMKKISGRLTNHSGQPLTNLSLGATIEFTTLLHADAPGGWIGSATISPLDGSFELFITYDLGTNESVSYNILKGNIPPLQSGDITTSNFMVSIPLTDEVLEELTRPDISAYITVRGSLTLGSFNIKGVPTDNNLVKIAAYDTAFTSPQIIAQTTIDSLGNYCIKVPFYASGPSGADPSSSCPTVTSSNFYLTLLIDNAITEKSALISQGPDCGCLVVDLHSDQHNAFPFFYSELEYVSRKVTAVTEIAAENFYSITTDGPDSELNRIVAVSGLDSSLVTKLVQAAIVARNPPTGIGIVVSHAYALGTAYGFDINSWTGQITDDLAAAINNAIDKHLVPEGGDSADTITKITNRKKDNTANVLTDNGESMATTLSSITTSEEDARIFLQVDADNRESTPNKYWEEVEKVLPEQSESLQKGLQLLSLTGMQPETTRELITRAGEQHASFCATYGIADWRALVDSVCSENSKLCVPTAIIELANQKGTDPRQEYAGKLLSVTHDMFTTAVISDFIQRDPDFAALLGTQAAPVKTFLDNNSDFDFRVRNVWDIKPADIPNIAMARTAIAPIQNVMRLVAGKPTAVVALMKDGVKSSADIAAMPLEFFVATYQNVLGGASAAQQTYTQATQTALVVSTIQSAVAADIIANPFANIISSLNGYVITDLNGNPPNAQSPDLASLFGSIDSCNCTECSSMYSPSAYFTDILNFIQTQIVTTAFSELKRRRPDLLNIDLTCKNSNTPLPYVDLVNEILERKILDYHNVPPTLTLLSYQTNGTAAELAAYPEHTIKAGPQATAVYQTDPAYKLVYDTILTVAFYPNTMPFHLPLEESRTYLKHLGYERHELMQQYKPKDYDTAVDTAITINAFNAGAEWLGTNKAEANIIITTLLPILPAQPRKLYEYYGFENPQENTDDWYDILFNNNVATANHGSLRTILERTGISYSELLQVLNTDFLNPVLPSSGGQRTFIIVSNHITVSGGQYVGQDTCNLDQLTILYSPDKPVLPTPPVPQGPLPTPSSDTISNYIKPFLDNLHRFVRLYRTTGWSIYQLDMILQSLSAYEINAEIFKNIAIIHRLSVTLNVAPEKLSGFWSDLSIRTYINYNSDTQKPSPSVYDNLFRNKAIINPNDPAFDNPTFPAPAPYTEHKGTLLAATNITEQELDILYAFLSPSNNTLNLTTISRVYALSILTSRMRTTVKDLLRVFSLYNITDDIFSLPPTELIEQLQMILADRQALTATGFNLNETDYLLRHQDAGNIYTPKPTSVEQFYESLRTELKKQLDKDTEVQTVNRDVLGNIVIREFSTTFNLDSGIIQALLKGVTTVTPLGDNTATATQKNLFDIPVTTTSGTEDVSLYDILTDVGFINSTESIITGGTLPVQDPEGTIAMDDLYAVFIKTHKTSMLTARLRISIYEFGSLLMGVTTTVVRAPDGTIISTTASPFLQHLFDLTELKELPVSQTSTPVAGSIDSFQNLTAWIHLRNRLALEGEDLVSLMQQIVVIPNSIDGLDNFLTSLSGLTSWSLPALQFLLEDTPTVPGNILNVIVSPFNNDFLKAALLEQVADIMDAAGRLGLSPQITYPALKADLTLDQSQPIRQAAKAKYTDAQWAVVAKPLQDVLREKQRQALVDYMVVRPNIGDTNVASQLRWKDANGLFAYYLIDVEMKPVMLTSRIKQAISTAQLYVLRIIQNLERAGGLASIPITIGVTQMEQWETWRKWYRVWEANRKVFLYPENWMEPTLRDDKTPFFKELETQLKQNEVTADTAEKALMAYLEDLDKVAKLEPVSAYHQIESDPGQAIDIKHVFARTNSEPHHYYYRTLQNKIWSPWEKVTVDIKSDHVTPVMWNRRLYLFWLTFTPKQSKKWYPNPPGVIPTNDPNYSIWTNMIQRKNNKILTIVVDGNQDDKQTTWDIKLSWTQYKDGKWLAAEMCKDVMHIEPSQFVLSADEINRFNSYQPVDLQEPYFSALTANGEQQLADLFKNRLYLSPFFDGNSEDKALNLSLIFFSCPNEKGAITLSTFIFPDPLAQPYVDRFYWEREDLLLSPIGTRARSMKFDEITTGDQNAFRKVKIDAVTTYQDWHFSYSYGGFKSNPAKVFVTRRMYGTNHTTLLTDRPNGYGRFRLTKFANATGGNDYSVIRDYFFYEDDKNTYFVQKNPAPVLTVLESLGLSTQFSAGGMGIMAAPSTALGNIMLSSTINAASASYVTASSPNSFVMANNNSTSFTGVANLTGGSMPSTQTNGGAVYNPPSQFYDYRFYTFYHAQIHNFMKILNKDGVKGLLQLQNQKHSDDMNFASGYLPTTSVTHYLPNSTVSVYPNNEVQFASEDPYSIYNWEIFFHAPMLIADQLNGNQQYEDAQKWYHYIFDPTSSVDGISGQLNGDVKRFWKFFPFYEISTTNPQTLEDLLIALNSIANNNNATSQVAAMQNDPFNPYVIGRMRKLAFMKNVVMKYLDNLIDWGDMLFRQNTIESINEATQLYILAANILGKRPESIPARATSGYYTYQELLDATNGVLGLLSNPLVNIESFFGPNAGIPTNAPAGNTSGTTAPPPVFGKMFYFCIPSNDVLLGYWDTVADRLFKIRNSMNIEGLVQQLPLYEPPIDPALLVRARAMGIDIASIVNAISSSAAGALSNYRFAYMLQKANEFCSEVRALGGALLAALEKKDAEGLALLRSTQEINLLDQMTFIKQSQVDEAQAALDAANLTKEITQLRYDYYSSRTFTNNYEQQHLQSIQTGLVLQAIQSGLESTAGFLGTMPGTHAQGLASGISFSGFNYISIAKAASAAVGIASVINNSKGAMASTMGGYQRRQDDWTFQSDTASKELEQVDKQILSAQIRLDMANRELDNHQLQLSNAKATDDFMRNKFTNEELYTWMSGQLASTYFKSYQLAYDLAKKADNCYQSELPLSTKYPGGGFVTFGYWDSLRKGLLSGENLQFDLRRMEAAYMDDNVRELELTKHISLALFDPASLLDLRQSGTCTFNLKEEWFDLDYPGQYLRRIKSVSISMPCIAGPYTTINCTLRQNKSQYRKFISVLDPYAENTAPGTIDDRFVKLPAVPGCIATSTAQNDSGVFELNFRDERYLPFENTGAISEWILEFPSDTRQFDFETISDVILHIRYTSREGGDTLKSAANGYITALISNSGETLLPRYFSVKHEFSNFWFMAFQQKADVDGSAVGRPFSLPLRHDLFPQYAGNRTIQISVEDFHLKTKEPIPAGTVYKLVGFSDEVASHTVHNHAFPIPMSILYGETAAFEFTLYKEVDNVATLIEESELSDLFIVMHYHLDEL
jgi:hypothetical protein